ncbi:hypothetical protein AD998_01175 [bacterium 336/3]|nr:hypothetical protein AD998_01175 [bacterium 336/3]
MKYCIIVLCASFLFFSCKEKRHTKSFIVWKNTEGIKKFVHIKDKSYRALFLHTKEKKINDTISQSISSWFVNSLIFSDYTENISPNYVDLVDIGMYELDSNNTPMRLNGEILRKQLLKNGYLEHHIQYISKRNIGLTYDIKRKTKSLIKSIDTLDIKCSDCMIIQGSSIVKLIYNNLSNKKDTMGYSESISILKKNEGLIFFGNKENNISNFYVLEKYLE